MTSNQLALVEARERLQLLHIQYDDTGEGGDVLLKAEREYRRLLHLVQEDAYRRSGKTVCAEEV